MEPLCKQLAITHGAGVELGLDGIIRTDANLATGQHSLIRDAFIAVNSTGGYAANTNYPNPSLDKSQYYLNNTNFVNNLVGLNDYYKGVAQAGKECIIATFIPTFHRCYRHLATCVATQQIPRFLAVPASYLGPTTKISSHAKVTV